MPTHGSLNKAGKVRDRTPKIRNLNKKKLSPRLSRFNRYNKLKKEER